MSEFIGTFSKFHPFEGYSGDLNAYCKDKKKSPKKEKKEKES